MHDSKDTREAITKGMQMTLLAGFLGWMMDGYEQALFPTLAGPALRSMVPGEVAASGAKAISGWIGGWMAGIKALIRGQSLALSPEPKSASPTIRRSPLTWRTSTPPAFTSNLTPTRSSTGATWVALVTTSTRKMDSVRWSKPSTMSCDQSTNCLMTPAANPSSTPSALIPRSPVVTAKPASASSPLLKNASSPLTKDSNGSAGPYLVVALLLGQACPPPNPSVVRQPHALVQPALWNQH